MLAFDSITYRYGDEPVLQDVSLVAEAGEVTCVVGPSGCGKTTLLRLAAGLLGLQSGTISLDGEVLGNPRSQVPPEQRPVGLVFQEGALFPHLTVADNVGFGIPKAERAARIAELLALVGLTQWTDRYPHTLSGGQRQRVALARAMGPRPRALLFDEPYANLDPSLRRSLREEARKSIRESGTIGVFVTHDPDDVMALADQVVVLEGGAVLQAGTPRELYDDPVSPSVARLFSATSAVRAEVLDERLRTAFGDWDKSAMRESRRGAVELTVRPDWLELQREEADSGTARIVDLRVAGRFDHAEVRAADGSRVYVELERPHPYQVGDGVKVMPRTGRLLASSD